MLDLSRFEGHTPGPWKRGDNGGIRKANGVFSCVPHSSAWIEDAWYGNDATPETLANDALIAAAPDLLAEVKRLRGHFAKLEAECRKQKPDYITLAGIIGLAINNK